jgi:crossover junction endodeoxyribonuclease RuvC
MKPHRILGIDPGTQIMGYAVVEVDGQKITLLTLGILRLQQLDDHPQKLLRILERVQEVIRRYSPRDMAIEAPFYAKNVQAMFKLARAQGVAIAAAMSLEVDVHEYAPRRIKQSVAGNGNASKEQLHGLLAHIVGKPLDTEYFDASDALAVAVCHALQFSPAGLQRNSTGGSKKKRSTGSWSSFVKDNPERID